jgi:hypothetical protein
MVSILISGRANGGPKSAARYPLGPGSSTLALFFGATEHWSLRYVTVTGTKLAGRLDNKGARMRTVILILIIAIVGVIGAVATGFLDIQQIRGAKAPQVVATGNGIVAKGGQAPSFDVETGSVKVGSKEATVKVPKLEVSRPAQNEAAPATNNMM